MVGVKGKFTVTITRRQLVLSNQLKKGIRLDLASISRTRSIDIPKIPGGVVLWGSAACYLGATVLIPPLGYVVSLIGASSALSHFIFKNPALVIETSIGGKHIIQSKINDQENLLKVQMMIEKVNNGQSVEEAKSCLEREFKSQRNIKIEPKGLLIAPTTSHEDLSINNQIQILENPHLKTKIDTIKVQPSISQLSFEAPEPIINTNFQKYPTTNSNSYDEIEKNSAYEQTWGRNEPEWYNEKTHNNRIDSVIEDTNTDADSNLFGFGSGGIFDLEPAASSFVEPVNYSSPSTQQTYSAPEQYINQVNNQKEATNSIFGEFISEPEIEDRPISSAGMIKLANGLNRSPINSNYRNNPELPAPTDEAVRMECKPGLVKRAKAQQSLQRKAEIMAALPAPTDLGEYPGLSKIASSLGDGRLVLRNQPIRKKKLGFLERILLPKSPSYVRENMSYAEEYGDPDGLDANQYSRFQSKQHLRLRSDQEHQADITNRIRRTENTKPSSGKDALNIVVSRVSRGEEHSPTVLVNHEPLLSFNQMRRTSNKDDSGHVKGIRRLE
ncbi:MAG: hypothetical protein NLN66_03815 [Candidatus Thalassarchaeaceae archaeon]|nr:hypothetical protein [Candidatus Thalassarchaeaceae archaeon]